MSDILHCLESGLGENVGKDFIARPGDEAFYSIDHGLSDCNVCTRYFAQELGK